MRIDGLPWLVLVSLVTNDGFVESRVNFVSPAVAFDGSGSPTSLVFDAEETSVPDTTRLITPSMASLERVARAIHVSPPCETTERLVTKSGSSSASSPSSV